ncbi:tetratricopeptide repeat protein [Myceligenerans salitolerans]|uniref:Tetratricopeptide repeat protein n=1 Tax=Myceligenerans salitolerans TaxID=1230528 RepID=A0ABS3IC73_9MICO|nr:tetratricopeptide repeat protein [Myceligenerans salitolerans]MBO0610593.1 tetratricopeptide repeat protein [Myceligenerans salitolerans]
MWRPLHPDSRLRARHARVSAAGLLDPALRAVPFVGRDTELDELHAWCRERPRVQVRFVTGTGGVGKSRLAIELAARLRRRGWTCVWPEPDDSPAEIAAACRGGRVLVVVDDAAAHPRLAEQLGALTGSGENRLRVILLGRTAREWWTRLRWACDLWAGPETVPTSQVHLAPPRLPAAAMVSVAARAFARRPGVQRRLSGPRPGVPEVREGPEPAPVLDVHAATLAALLHGGVADVSRGVGALLDLEREAWTAPDEDIAGALLRGEEFERGAPDTSPSRADGGQGAPSPLSGPGGLPNRLAELHVARTLAADPAKVRACTTGLDARQAFRVALFAHRLDVDDPGVPEAARLATVLLERVAEALPDDAEAIARVLRLFGRRPLPRDVAVGLAERLIAVVGELAPGGRAVTPERADATATLARALGAPETYDDVPPSAQGAVTAWRELAAQDPDRYRVPLLAARTVMAGVLFGKGRYTESLQISDEVAAVCRAAAPEERVWLDPMLASALNGMAITYDFLGRPEQVEVCHTASVATLRRLVARDPAAHEAMLALVLANTVGQVELGRAADVIDGLRESVEIRRRLTLRRPGEHEQYLAFALSNLSDAAAQLDRPAEAVAAAREALAIRRRFAEQDPVGMRWLVAWSLAGLGSLLSEQGRAAEAAGLEEESVRIRRQLAAETPQRYRDMLATSCSNLAVTYARLGRSDEALPLEEEAVGIRRELAARVPGRYEEELARSLSRLSVRLTEANRPLDAVAPATEAVSMLRDLARSKRPHHQDSLAVALTNLATVLRSLGRAEAATAAVQEAFALRDESVELVARERGRRGSPSGSVDVLVDIEEGGAPTSS